MYSSHSSQASAFLLLSMLNLLSCTDKQHDCQFLANCPEDGMGGGAGDSGTDGGAGGNASVCSPSCSGAKPICDATSRTCVECIGDENCSQPTPLCDTSKNSCIQCKSNTDCRSASASLCSAGTCSPCSQDTDCSQISGKGVCNAGTCVQCTGAKYSACGQSATSTPLVCDSLSHTCSTKAQASAGLCQTCVSDAQCQAGEMCANEMFNGSAVGYFCFYKQGATGAPAVCGDTGRPYVKTLTGATSIDGQTADICTLRSSTCTALNEFSSKDCASAGSASDQLCGFAPGVDSKCVAFTSTQNLCTVTCGSSLDCPVGVNFTCNTGAPVPICTFQ